MSAPGPRPTALLAFPGFLPHMPSLAGVRSQRQWHGPGLLLQATFVLGGTTHILSLPPLHCVCPHVGTSWLIFMLLPAAQWYTEAAGICLCPGPACRGRCPTSNPVPFQLLEKLEGGTLGTSSTPGVTHRKLSASLWPKA